MSDTTIVCPTHGRAGNVRAFGLFGPDLILCVQKGEQEELYREAYPKAELLVHPELHGLSLKRQWIYDTIGDVFMTDDDVVSIVDLTAGPGEQTRRVDGDFARAVVQRSHESAEAAGVFAYSFAQSPDPATFRPQKPLRLSGMITGCALGLRAGSKLWFPEGFHGSEDIFLSGLNAHYHRMAWIDLRYSFTQLGTFGAIGGQGLHRTMADLRKNFYGLQEAFGESVMEKKEDTFRARAGHDWAITMRLPF